MPRKKKEETQEVKPEIKMETKTENKINPFGWTAVVNKAKFTKTK